MGGLHADEAGRHGDVADHHHGDDDAQRQPEPQQPPPGENYGGQAQAHTNRGAPAQDDRQMRPGLRESGPDGGRTLARDSKGEHGVQEEARRGKGGNGQDDRDHDGTGQYMERLPVQHVSLQVEHGGPDPHRRRDLDQGQAPVSEQQLHSVKQHGQGTDRQSEGSEPSPRTAQPYYRLFYGLTVAVADGLNDLPDPDRKVPPRPGRLADANPWPRV